MEFHTTWSEASRALARALQIHEESSIDGIDADYVYGPKMDGYIIVEKVKNNVTSAKEHYQKKHGPFEPGTELRARPDPDRVAALKKNPNLR